jgi:hypothetical protein
MTSAKMVVAACVVLGGCTISPENGQLFTGSTVDESVSFLGYTEVPGASVRAQILSPAGQDPYDPASTWTTIATSTAGTTPYYHNDPDPLYGFNFSGVPRPSGTASRWRNGGLARLRVQWDDSGTWTSTYTFDEFDCIMDNIGESWKTIGTSCLSHDSGVITLVDTDPLPTPTVDYLSRRATSSSAEGMDYYDTVGAGPGESRETFAGWLAANRFTGGPFIGATAAATYYNLADLGVGREMHCRKNLTGLVVSSIACYVTNYGTFTDGTADQASALADAIALNNPIATVAMEWYPGGGSNNVRFFVYDAGGALDPDPALDTQGPKPVPGICIACHGGSYNEATNSLTGAQFLPFDLDAFAYSSTAGYTRTDQEEDFRKLNSFVAATSPTTAISDLIDGWYGGAVNTAGTTFDGDHVPSGWSGESTVYREVVARYCRMCHQSRTGTLDFADLSDFTTYAATIESDVCTSWAMPHAEIPHKAFWESKARAHLFGGVLGRYPSCDSN